MTSKKHGGELVVRYFLGQPLTGLSFVDVFSAG
jgi:hypothetical protein